MSAPKPGQIYYVPEGSPVFPDRFDTRIRLRNVTRGIISPKELETYLASLPDESANAHKVDLVELLALEDDGTDAGDISNN